MKNVGLKILICSTIICSNISFGQNLANKDGMHTITIIGGINQSRFLNFWNPIYNTFTGIGYKMQWSEKFGIHAQLFNIVKGGKGYTGAYEYVDVRNETNKVWLHTPLYKLQYLSMPILFDFKIGRQKKNIIALGMYNARLIKPMFYNVLWPFEPSIRQSIKKWDYGLCFENSYQVFDKNQFYIRLDLALHVGIPKVFKTKDYVYDDSKMVYHSTTDYSNYRNLSFIAFVEFGYKLCDFNVLSNKDKK